MTTTANGYHDPYDDGNEKPDDPGNFGEHWKSGEAPEQPRFPEAVLQWYSTAVAEWVTTKSWTENAAAGSLGWIEKFTKWYQGRPSDFLQFHRAFAMWPVWRLNEDAMWGALPRAEADLGWVEPGEAEPAKAKEPMAPATEAHVDAALLRMETEKAPDERRAATLLDGKQFKAYWKTRRRIEAKIQHACQCCLGLFTIPSGQHFVNCPTCRASHKKRCIRCQEIFTADKHARRCPACVAKRAELDAFRRIPK